MNYLAGGTDDVRFDAAGLASGIYLIQLTTLEGASRKSDADPVSTSAGGFRTPSRAC